MPAPPSYQRSGTLAALGLSATVVLPAFRVPSCGCGTSWCEFPGQYDEVNGMATPFMMPFLYLGAFLLLQFNTETATRAGMRALALAGAVLTATFAYVGSSPSALAAPSRLRSGPRPARRADTGARPSCSGRVPARPRSSSGTRVRATDKAS